MGCGDLTIPQLAFMAFQLAFAVITLAILTSAMAERVKISGFIVFGLLWTTLILAKLVDATIGLRVTEEVEYVGLDISQHGEEAYAGDRGVV